VKGIQPSLPQDAIPAQPLIDLAQWFGAKTVDPPLRFLANLDKPGLSKHPKMT